MSSSPDLPPAWRLVENLTGRLFWTNNRQQLAKLMTLTH